MTFTDDFNRANDPSLGGSYTNDTIANGASATFDLISNSAQLQAGSYAEEYRNDADIGPDGTVGLDFATLPNGSGWDMGLTWRIQSAGNCYRLTVSATAVKVYKYVSGTGTQIGTDISATATAQRYEVDFAGNVFSVYTVPLAGGARTLLASRTDGSSTYLAAGKVGLYAYEGSGASVHPVLDNFAGTTDTGGLVFDLVDDFDRSDQGEPGDDRWIGDPFNNGWGTFAISSHACAFTNSLACGCYWNETAWKDDHGCAFELDQEATADGVGGVVYGLFMTFLPGVNAGFGYTLNFTVDDGTAQIFKRVPNGGFEFEAVGSPVDVVLETGQIVQWRRDGDDLVVEVIDAGVTEILRVEETSYTGGAWMGPWGYAPSGGGTKPTFTNFWAGGTVVTDPPSNLIAPALTSGVTIPGFDVACSTGLWLGNPTYEYQWLRDGSDILGETGSTYTLIEDDIGHDVSCLVTATNDYGSDDAESGAVSVTAGPPDPDFFLVWGVDRVPTRIRVATADGRYP